MSKDQKKPETKVRRATSVPMQSRKTPGQFFQREVLAVYIKNGDDVDEALRLMAEGRELMVKIEVEGIPVFFFEHVYPCKISAGSESDIKKLAGQGRNRKA